MVYQQNRLSLGFVMISKHENFWQVMEIRCDY